MTVALEGGEWSATHPGRTLPPGKTRHPFYRRLGWSQDRSGWAENLVPTRIQSRTIQPVVSRYTDWGTRPTHVVDLHTIDRNAYHRRERLGLYQHLCNSNLTLVAKATENCMWLLICVKVCVTSVHVLVCYISVNIPVMHIYGSYTDKSLDVFKAYAYKIILF